MHILYYKENKHGVGSSVFFCCCRPLRGEMSEQPAGEHCGGSSDTEQGLLIQPATPNSRGISSPSSGKASPSLVATATGGKKPGYYSENGCLMELSRQERRRIQQEINKRFKPGEMKEILKIICHSYSHAFIGGAGLRDQTKNMPVTVTAG